MPDVQLDAQSPHTLAWTPDSQFVLVACDQRVTLCDATTGLATETYSAPTLRRCAVSGDGRLLGGLDYRGELHVWRLPGFTPVASRALGERSISTPLTFTAHGLLGGDGDGRVVLLDPESLQTIKAFTSPEAHDSQIICFSCALSEDGAQVVAGLGSRSPTPPGKFARWPVKHTAVLFDGASGAVLDVRPHKNSVNWVGFRGGDYLTAGCGRNIEITRGKKKAVTLKSHPRAGPDLMDVNQLGTVAVSAAPAGDEVPVRLWDLTMGTSLGTLRGSGVGASCLALAPDGTRVAFGRISAVVSTL